MKIRTLVIDDEPLAQQGLKDHIKETEFLELTATAEDALEAKQILARQSIDLIFLDIQMPRISGIEFLQALEHPPMVIICSAHPHYAIKGFELDVLDYLLKPVSYERFLKAALKAKDLYTLKQTGQPELLVTDDHFYVKCDSRIERINISELLYVEAMGNYVTIHTKKKKFLAYLTLRQMEDYLPAQQFLRIHKSYLVPVNEIQSIEPDAVVLGEVTLPLSRNYRDSLLEKIAGRMIRR